MTANRRALDIARRRQKVAELYLQGWTQTAIAERLEVTQATVSGDLKQIREAWRIAASRAFDEARALELQKLDRIEREAWAAWERSQKPLMSAVVQGQNRQSARQTVKDQHGDPRFLDLVHKCIAARRSLLGLDAPHKILSADARGRGLNLSDLFIVQLSAPISPPANVIDIQAELSAAVPALPNHQRLKDDKESTTKKWGTEK